MRTRITPDNITELVENEVFVFGSNLAGRHGAGAALIAHTVFGARYGKAEGLMGIRSGRRCYAIPTKDQWLRTLRLDQIERHVARFISVALVRDDLHFLVTPIGCGLAGYLPRDIAPLFRAVPSNVSLPLSFWEVIDPEPDRAGPWAAWSDWHRRKTERGQG